MALNVQFIDMQNDNFAPVEAFGYDKYEVGSTLARSNGFDPSRSKFLGRNEVFSEMRQRARVASEDMRSMLQVTEIDDGEGVVESWADYSDMRDIGRINHVNIMSYKPVQRLMREGRISGFGYEPESLPVIDIIGRMINNGRSDVAEDGSYHKKVYRYSDDLPYTRDQLDRFERQRAMIDMCLAETDLDPTDTNLERT